MVSASRRVRQGEHADAAASRLDGLGGGRARAPDRHGRAWVPDALRGARWSVGGSAAVALLVVASVVGVAVAVRAAQQVPGVPVPTRIEASGETTSPEPAGGTGGVGVDGPAGTAGTGTASGDPPTGDPPTGDPPTGEAPRVVVHVVGAVEAPGLVRLPSGSRVADALEAAGGATSEADLALVNLARALVDGEQVVVPRPGDEPAAIVPPGPAPSPGGPGEPGAGSVVLSLNTATLEQLDGLPGIGPVLAQRILDWRSEHGSFTDVAELGEVRGIGDAVLADLEALVTV